ncbi:Uncharacterised protein [Mycobacteroides abscessus]|nr:Uncharacterised protein [Mycobacteroides abscessus]
MRIAFCYNLISGVHGTRQLSDGGAFEDHLRSHRQSTLGRTRGPLDRDDTIAAEGKEIVLGVDIADLQEFLQNGDKHQLGFL